MHPVSATYVGTWRHDLGDGLLRQFQPQHPGRQPGGSGAFDATTAGSLNGVGRRCPAGIFTVALRVTHSRSLAKDWQLRFNPGRPGHARPADPAGAVRPGGAASIRGLAERQFALDNGWFANFEVYTPDLASLFKLSENVRLRALVFHDTGRLLRSQAHFAGVPIPGGEPARFGASSNGIGVRLALGQQLSVRLDAAFANMPGDIRLGRHWARSKQFRMHGSPIYLF